MSALHPRTRRVSLARRVIEGIPVTFRTFDPPRRTWRDMAAPESTIDGLVTITVARVRWLERPNGALTGRRA